MFPDELHTHSLYISVYLNQHNSWALPTLRAVNPPPANNPKSPASLCPTQTLPACLQASLFTGQNLLGAGSSVSQTLWYTILGTHINSGIQVALGQTHYI